MRWVYPDKNGKHLEIARGMSWIFFKHRKLCGKGAQFCLNIGKNNRTFKKGFGKNNRTTYRIYTSTSWHCSHSVLRQSCIPSHVSLAYSRPAPPDSKDQPVPLVHSPALWTVVHPGSAVNTDNVALHCGQLCSLGLHLTQIMWPFNTFVDPPPPL